MTFSIDSTMDGYYSQERLQELWQKIGTLHLSYLELEESTQKIEQRNKLEDYIKEFLCLAPHNLKFILQETADVLHRSASSKKDFSGYKAALGWSAIGMYAANLLNQPWRKEYRQIQLYSGFYKHQIEANLVGAEVMFKAMGYKHDGDGVLTLDGPICPDRVVSISQDSLIAYVECQILKVIWEEVTLNYNITWLEVLEFRETHLCSPKQSIQALNYRHHERHYQQYNRTYSQGTGRHLSNAYPSSMHPLSSSFPPLHSHTSVASIPVASQCIYGTNGYCNNNYATYAPVISQHYQYHVPLTCSQTIVKPSHHSTNYFPNGCLVPPPPPPYVCPAIPTGQLIEVDNHSLHHYDTVDAASQSQTSRFRGLDSKNLTSSSDLDEIQSNTIGSWDYVYRNLESQGYSKDLGERGDILSPSVDGKKSKLKESKKCKLNIEDAINNLSINDTSFHKERINSEVSKINNERNKISEEVNLKKSAKQPINGYVKTHTLPAQKTMNISEKPEFVNNKASNSKTLDLNRKASNGEHSNKEGSNIQNKWQCSTCTFLNDLSRGICEMCGKSKVKILDIMEIGGSQCPLCTLVNPKDNKTCDACSGSLKDSPTYI